MSNYYSKDYKILCFKVFGTFQNHITYLFKNSGSKVSVKIFVNFPSLQL
uniref:Uncharacterized protein n=1 Tax=Lepeophtheirus salmonis TaxID=72036 RepID=A0A0K2U666_LEPSM